MPRIIFTDKLIRSGGGHNLEYCLRLVDAFAALGYEPVFLVNREFKGVRPPGLKAAIAFDFNRVVLGQEARAKRKLELETKRRRAKRRMKERFYFSPIGIAHLALNEMRRGAHFKQIDRGLMFGAFLIGSTALALRLLALFVWILTWPYRIVMRGLRWLTGKAKSTRLADALRARRDLLWARLAVKEPLRLLRALLQSQDKLEQALVASIGQALSRLDPTEDDIVLCTTTVASDLNIYLKVLEQHPKTRKAHWNFIFREPIFLNQGPSYVIGQNQRSLRTKLIAFDTLPDVRTGWWVDTEELAEQYSHLGVFPFNALPIPMPAELATFVGDPAPTDRPLNIGYLGDARPEKGYCDLSTAMRDLSAKHRYRLNRIYKLVDLEESDAHALALPDRLAVDKRAAMLKRRAAYIYGLERKRLQTAPIDNLQNIPSFTMLAQSNFNVPDGVDQTRSERYRLMGQDDIGVKLILSPPSSAEYIANVRRSDLFMLNYRHPLYHAGSSGVFAEAMMAGRPVLVSDDTWGGRRLRTSPEYVEHLKELVATRASLEIQVAPIKHASHGLAWRVLPPLISHLVTTCEFSRRDVTDQLAWIAEFRTTDGAVISRRRLLCSRIGAAAAIVEIPANAVLVRCRIERLNPLLSLGDWSLKTFGLDIRAFDLPLAAAGVVVSDSTEIAPGLADIGRHYRHYRASAASFAKAWAKENDADLLAAKVVGHARGAPLDVTSDAPPLLTNAA
ncbi:hypothetical protein ASD89_07680 [Caulobacter sp. Root656]|nr:hypothetical protein ASD89_07680 [Caulobacter sp. Root656]